MHTISELGHTGDVLASVHAMHLVVQKMEQEKIDTDSSRRTIRALTMKSKAWEEPPKKEN